MAEEKPVISVDPGRGKCGIAVVFRSGRVAEQRIVPREDLIDAVQALANCYEPAALVMGDRTGSKDARRDLAPVVACPVVTVAEHETTLQARERYYRDNPPRGLAKLIPPGLRTPPRPLDDYAAILLAERYWKGVRR